MALKTKSSFYYGVELTTLNVYLDFNEGGLEKTALLTVGSYSPQSIAKEIERALNASGSQVYTVTANRVTRKLTISALNPFSLLFQSGSHTGNGLSSILGFEFQDYTGLNTYESDFGVGFEYRPQFYLLDYVPPSRNQDVVEATTTETSTGEIEIIRFGVKSFYDFTIDFITNQPMSEDSVIESNTQGLEQAEQFMQNIVKRGLIEFMPDRDKPENFSIVRLESTSQNRSGLGFRLIEKIGDGLPEYYSTGLLRFRVQE